MDSHFNTHVPFVEAWLDGTSQVSADYVDAASQTDAPSLLPARTELHNAQARDTIASTSALSDMSGDTLFSFPSPEPQVQAPLESTPTPQDLTESFLIVQEGDRLNDLPSPEADHPDVPYAGDLSVQDFSPLNDHPQVLGADPQTTLESHDAEALPEAGVVLTDIQLPATPASHVESEDFYLSPTEILEQTVPDTTLFADAHFREPDHHHDVPQLQPFRVGNIEVGEEERAVANGDAAPPINTVHSALDTLHDTAAAHLHDDAQDTFAATETVPLQQDRESATDKIAQLPSGVQEMLRTGEEKVKDTFNSAVENVSDAVRVEPAVELSAVGESWYDWASETASAHPYVTLGASVLLVGGAIYGATELLKAWDKKRRGRRTARTGSQQRSDGGAPGDR